MADLQPYLFADRIKPGLYRHYKGNLYRVLSLARHSETCEELVVYIDVSDPEKVWVRPAGMWNETVLVNGVQMPRFAEEEQQGTEVAD